MVPYLVPGLVFDVVSKKYYDAHLRCLVSTPHYFTLDLKMSHNNDSFKNDHYTILHHSLKFLNFSHSIRIIFSIKDIRFIVLPFTKIMRIFLLNNIKPVYFFMTSFFNNYFRVSESTCVGVNYMRRRNFIENRPKSKSSRPSFPLR